MTDKFKRFHRIYIMCIGISDNRKQAWARAERIWERKTGERYYKNYRSFRVNMSKQMRKKAK